MSLLNWESSKVKMELFNFKRVFLFFQIVMYKRIGVFQHLVTVSLTTSVHSQLVRYGVFGHLLVRSAVTVNWNIYLLDLLLR